MEDTRRSPVARKQIRVANAIDLVVFIVIAMSVAIGFAGW